MRTNDIRREYNGWSSRSVQAWHLKTEIKEIRFVTGVTRVQLSRRIRGFKPSPVLLLVQTHAIFSLATRGTMVNWGFQGYLEKRCVDSDPKGESSMSPLFLPPMLSSVQLLGLSDSLILFPDLRSNMSICPLLCPIT